MPPLLPAQPVVVTQWGVTVPDPYGFLEDTSDPMVQSWLKAQASATDAILVSIPGRGGLLARMQEIENTAAGLATSVVRTEGSRFFFQRRKPSDRHSKPAWRDGIDGAGTAIVDPEALSGAPRRRQRVRHAACRRRRQRQAGLAAAGLRVRTRAGQRARPVAGRHRRVVEPHAVAVRRAGVPGQNQAVAARRQTGRADF